MGLDAILNYREHLAARVVRAIEERNGGQRPYKVKELEPCFASWGATLTWVPPSILREPVIRNGLVLMPDRRAERSARPLLKRWLAHELAEVVMAAECHREYVGPGWHDDRHRVASLVEDLLISG